ncbi:hypothetical protein CRUP_014081, partial [Coryphaenoides rupestris]
MAAQLLAVALVALITTSSSSSSSSSNSTSAPQSDSCDDLVKPLLLDSHSPASWVDLSASTDNGVMTIYWADRLNDDKCLQGVANATITGMTSHTTFNINGHTSYHDGKYYETCAECLLSEDTTLLPDGETKGRYLFLFNKVMDVCAAVLALLALTNVGTAFATPRNWSRNCEELIKPFIPEDGSLVFGKWVYVMGSADPMVYRTALDAMKSSWIELSPTQDSQLVALRWGDHCYDRCVYGEYYETCAECLLSEDTTLLPDGETKGRYLFLFKKFKKQAECLKFLPEFYYGGT